LAGLFSSPSGAAQAFVSAGQGLAPAGLIG